jgi:type IV pilus assembly protein PilM
MSPLPAWLQSPPPALGLEVDAHRVTAVLVGVAGRERALRAHAVEALPPGALVPSLTGQNVVERAAVVGAIRRAVGAVGGRARRCALAIADTTAKVSLLRFEQVPANPRDLEQLVRLQLRKALPFPVEQAQVALMAGSEIPGGGREFLVTAARRAVIEEYEQVCAEAGLHAGTVDLATLNVLNLVLAGDAAQPTPLATSDWLLVHVTPLYSSFLIVRGGHVIFFRTRAADAEEDLADVVHQTRMYFEDRLAGQGFSRVLLAGASTSADTAVLGRELEARLGVRVEPVDVRRAAGVSDRIDMPGDLLAAVAAPAGLVLREG